MRKEILLTLIIFSIIVITACDKIDVSKLSDKDLERISKELIVCNKPYIRYASGCCLDKNDNGICDKDEEDKITKETPSGIKPPVTETPAEPTKSEIGENKTPKTNKTESKQDFPISDLDKYVGDLLCEGTDRVCLGIDRKTIKRTKFDVFGLKIVNILDSQNFDIIISRSTPSGYGKNKQEITSDNLIWTPKLRSVLIGKNEGKNIGIGVQVPADAVSGTYIFNVEVHKTSDGEPYSQLQKLYVDVP